MAAITIVWDPTTPPGSEALSNGDNRITEFKTGMAERLRNGGHQWAAASSTDQEDGRHVCGTAFTAGDAAALAGEFYWYDRDGSTVIMTLRDATAATPSELFIGAFKFRTTGNITAATGTFSGAVATGALTVSGIAAPEADNTRDLGINTTNRWRDLWIGRNATVVGTLAVTGVATFTAAAVFNGGQTFGTLAIFSAGATMNGALAINAAEFATPSVASTTRAIAITERMIHVTLTGNIILTLPAVAASTGRTLHIAVISASVSTQTCTVDGSGAELVDGGSDITLRPMTFGTGGRTNAVTLSCDGAAWYIMNTRNTGELTS